ncbi:MAG: hypothetical protein AB1656_08930 [Candidatus Omnitrophota bacterium]
MLRTKPTGQLSISSAPFRAALIDSDRDELARSSKILQSTGQIEIAAETASYSIAFSIVERSKPQFVFISADEESLLLIEKIHHACPGVKIVAMGSREDAELVLRSFRSGADEYLIKPLQPEELASVCERLHSRASQPANEPASLGRVVAFWGGRGGCGVTTLACNIAHALSQSQPTILVDLHAGQGDLGVYLDVQPSFSLRDLSESDERFDATLIDSVTIEHESGLKLLLQPDDGHSNFFQEDSVCSLVECLRHRYAFVVLDLGRDNEIASMVAPFVNDFFLVITQDLPSVFLSVRKLQFLCEAGFDMNRLVIAVNAYTKYSSVTLSRIAKTLGKKKIVTIRDDKWKVQSAINQGVPLSKISRRGKAAKDAAALANTILRQEAIPFLKPEKANAIELKPLAEARLLQVGG